MKWHIQRGWGQREIFIAWTVSQPIPTKLGVAELLFIHVETT